MDMLQIFGDYLHLLGSIILLIKILLTKNCAGISGRTQLLNALVITTRYLDLTSDQASAYETILKITFAVITYLTVITIFFLYRHTYDYKSDAFRIELLILPSVVLSLFLTPNFASRDVLRAFSSYLESVSIVPQIYHASKTKKIESIVVSYVACLGLYEGCYVMHWFYDYAKNRKLSRVDVATGLCQLIFYVDFFARNLPIFKANKDDDLSSISSSSSSRFNRVIQQRDRTSKTIKANDDDVRRNEADDVAAMLVVVDDLNATAVDRDDSRIES